MRVLLAPLSSIFTCVREGRVRLVAVWNPARLLHGPRGLTLHLVRWGRGRGTGVRESGGWNEGHRWQDSRCPQEVTFGDGLWGLWTRGLVGG